MRIARSVALWILAIIAVFVLAAYASGTIRLTIKPSYNMPSADSSSMPTS